MLAHDVLKLVSFKVVRSKGMALFIVYVYPFKNKLDCLGNKNICLHVLTVFYLTQPSDKHIICFDFEKQFSAIP